MELRHPVFVRAPRVLAWSVATAALVAAQKGVRVNAPLARATVGDVLEFQVSPDSRRVVYRADQDQDEVFRLYSVPIDGGEVVALGRAPVAGGDVLPFVLQISTDSSVAVYRADLEADEVVELYASPLDGGPDRKLSGALVAGGDVQSFALSADAARVVYLADQEADERFELYSVALAGGAPVRLNGPLVAGGDVQRFLVAPDGQRVVFAADATTDGVPELYQVPITGGPALRLAPELHSGLTFAISPDSQRVVFNDLGHTQSVSILGGAPTELWGSRAGFLISPDSRFVVLLTPNLCSIPIQGGLVVPLSHVRFGRPHQVAITPDSRTVVYTVRPGDSVVQLHTVPIRGGPDVVIDDGSYGSESQFAISPDSRTLLHTLLVSAENGSAFTYRVPTGGGALVPLSERPLMGGLFTPDSRFVLTVQESPYHAFTVALDGSGEQQLTEPSLLGSGLHGIVLSPDGTRVVFSLENDDDRVYDLYSMPLHGGPRVHLNAPLVAGPIAGDVSHGAYSPDGAWIVYRADQDTDEILELYRAPAGGGAPVKLDAPLGRSGDVEDFRISPDSRRVVYAADVVVGGVRDLYSVPIEGGTAVPLNLEHGTGSGIYLYEIAPDSRRVVYVNEVEGQSVLFSVPIEGGPSVALSSVGDGDVLLFRTAPDATRVVYAAYGPGYPLQLLLSSVPIEGGATTPLHSPGAGLTGFSGFLEVLPDSSGVVYSAMLETPGVAELYRSDIHGAGTVRLSELVSGRDLRGIAVAPDSRHIVYVADQDTDEVFELFGVELTTLARTKLSGPLVAGGDAGDPRISPDSSTVVFRADALVDERRELFRVPIAGGPVARLGAAPVNGGDVESFRIAPDSARVVYLADERADEVFELYAAPLAGGASVALSGTLTLGGDVGRGPENYQLTPDGRSVLFVADGRVDEVFELFAAPVAGGAEPRRLSAALVLGGDVGGLTPYLTPFDVGARGVVYLADQEEDGRVELFESALTPPHRAR